MKYLTSFKPILSIALVGLLGGVLLSGCEDQLLDKEPRGELTQASFFKTEDHAVQATNATYEVMRGFNVHTMQWLGMTEMASDNASKGSTPFDGAFLIDLEEFSYDASNGAFGATWSGYYQGIYRANLAIKNIPDIDMDTGKRARLVGENKFLRAYYYFFLVRAFGGVPLLTEPIEPDEIRQPRASADSVYAQIVRDLQDAADKLPLKSEYPESELGRATQGAAQGLLAKVYMFRHNYEDAQDMAESVITSNEYSLYPDYDGIFQPEGENSSESLFEVQAVSNSEGLGGTPYSVVQGVRGTPNLGWGFNHPTQDLMQAYEPGDPRMQSTILFVHEMLPYGPEDVVEDNPNMNDERYNQKSFIPLNSPGGNWNGGSNIRRLRYADVMLLAAEAAYQNNEPSRARTLVNQVRERARGDQQATIGVSAGTLTGLVADTLGMSHKEDKPFVRYVDTEGPAADADIESYSWSLINNNQQLLVESIDIIESVDGTEVSNMEEFDSEMAAKSPGQDVSVEIQRVTQSQNDGQVTTDSMTVNVTVTAEQLLPDITSSGEQLLQDIRHERRVELAMEQHRFFDLQRQGRAAEVLGDQGYQEGVHDVYAIPQNELDLNPALEQNPGF